MAFGRYFMNNVNIGNSGEYFVAGELERRGFSVAVPMSNTKEFDILTINMKKNKSQINLTRLISRLIISASTVLVLI